MQEILRKPLNKGLTVMLNKIRILYPKIAFYYANNHRYSNNQTNILISHDKYVLFRNGCQTTVNRHRINEVFGSMSLVQGVQVTSC